MSKLGPPFGLRLSEGLGPLPDKCDDCRTPKSCGDGYCLEAYITSRIRQERDCRSCRNFTTASGGCVSVLRCVEASGYKRQGVMQFWEAAPVDPAPF